MSQFKKTKSLSAVGQLALALQTGMAQQSATLLSDKNARHISAGLESHTNVEATNAFQAAETFAQSIAVDVAGQMNEQVADLACSAGLESAAIVVNALGNPDHYLEAARKASRPAEGTAIRGPLAGGAAGVVQMSSGLEAFDTQEIAKYAHVSIAYNLSAPRQDEFSELLYPIIVATPDEAFYKVSVRRTTVFNGASHDKDGSVTDFDKRNLLDAYRDATVLTNNATALVPYATDAQADLLADEAIIGTTEAEVNGVKVPTRPMVIGKDINLLGISQHPALVAAGALNQSDQIDRALNLDHVWIKVTKAAETDQFIKLDVSKMQGNTFLKSAEGQGYEGALRFRPNSIIFDEHIRDIAGAELTAFADLKAAGTTAIVGAIVDGDVNFEQGRINVRGSSVKANEFRDSSGEVLAASTVLDGVGFEIVYFDVDAKLTNANKRTRGQLLDSDLWEEVYEIGLLAPISIQFPIAEDKHLLLTTESLVEATHVTIANSSVTSALNYAEHLNAFYRSNIKDLSSASIRGEGIEGIGRLLVTPFYEEIEVDLEQVINSITSADKLADVRGYFVGLLNEMGYRMAQKSGYLPVLRKYTQNPKATPKLLIATDQVLPSFMFVAGDPRVAGPAMEHEIATTPDARMEGEILLTFGGVKGDFCPINFGNLIYIPELVSTTQVQRDGGIVMESMVQPRFRTVNNLPVMAKITVKNLDILMKSRTAVNMKSV